LKKDLSLLYLTINETISAHGGVSNKLFNKVEALDKEVERCIFLNAKMSLENDSITEKTLKEGFSEVEIGVKKANTGYLKKVKSDKLFYERLASFLQERNYRFDRIVCRYPLASFGLLKFTKTFENKIVFEHNAFELSEVKLSLQNRKHIVFSLRPSLFFYWLQEIKLPVYYEEKIAGKIYRHANSGACVTRAIAEYEKKWYPAYKTFVSSNFYQVSSVQMQPNTWNPDIELLSLGFIVTNFAPWYGIERLLRSFSKIQQHYKLYLVGIHPEDPYLRKLLKEYSITQHFFCPGRLDQGELADFYHQMHATFGSLAVYKSDTTFASTLKVKESIAYGRPVILGYFEEDFYGNEAFDPYYLQFPNDDSDLDFEKIENFARQFYSDPENQIKLRNLALHYMDAGVKMKKLVENIQANL
jgi:hypothetical protein